MSEIEVTNVVEHEDGSATYTFDMDEKSAIAVAELGLKLALYCAVCETTTEEVLDRILEEAKELQTDVKETATSRFDEYGNYGENNPPVMSKPGDKDYEV